MLIEMESGTDWGDLKQWIAAILEESGLVVEIAQLLKKARGTVEIDVYAKDLKTTPLAIYLCECERRGSRVPQAYVRTFQPITSDAGAHFAIFVSDISFQAGDSDVVKNTNIHLLSWQDFLVFFIERWCRTYWVPTLKTPGDRKAGYLQPPHSDKMIRKAYGEPLTEAESVVIFVHDMWGLPFNDIAAAILGQQNAPVVQAIWSRRDLYRKYLPKAAAEAKFLRELLYALLGFGSPWERKQDYRRFK